MFIDRRLKAIIATVIIIYEMSRTYKIVYLPYEISPLIKLARWTLLVAGVIYGFRKRREYSVIEAELREEEEKVRPIREAHLARVKAIRNEAELKELTEIFLGSSLSMEEKNSLTNESLNNDNFNTQDTNDSPKLPRNLGNKDSSQLQCEDNTMECNQ